MALKNAYSKSPASFDVIQQTLARHGARQIMFDYDRAGRVVALAFSLEIGSEMRSFRLPARSENVIKILYPNEKSYTASQKEQAYRTAWANIRDWVTAQMALVETAMASIDEIFLPYMLTSDGETVYEAFIGSRLALPRSEDAHGSA